MHINCARLDREKSQGHEPRNRRTGLVSIVVFAGLTVPLAPRRPLSRRGTLCSLAASWPSTPVARPDRRYAGAVPRYEQGQDWNAEHAPMPTAQARSFWAPGGKQTNEYLKVSTIGATLVTSASNGTIFARRFRYAHGAGPARQRGAVKERAHRLSRQAGDRGEGAHGPSPASSGLSGRPDNQSRATLRRSTVPRRMRHRYVTRALQDARPTETE